MRRVIVASLFWAIFLRPAFAETHSLGTPQTPAGQGAGKQTTLDGEYSASQVTRGQAGFAMHCSSCHSEDLSGYSGPPLKGTLFIDNWREASLEFLYTLIKDTMPRRGDKLTEATYLDILAYILQRNEYPAGTNELTAAAVPAFGFVGKNGPAPVPEYALVRIAGCLTQRPDGIWLLTRATDPIRTRNEGKSTQEELNASGVRPFGNQTFRLVYPDFEPGFDLNSHKGHKMESKGHFLTNPVDQRLSVIWMGRVADGCDQ